MWLWILTIMSWAAGTSVGLAQTVPTGTFPAASGPSADAATETDAPAEAEQPPAFTIEPVAFSVIEIVPRDPNHWDATVFADPDAMSPIAGHVERGARLPVRGGVAISGARYCATDLFYALSPFGFLCADDAQPSTQTPSTDKVLELRDDSPLPYEYAMVHVEEGEEVPMWASTADVSDYAPPKRMLGRGDTIAVQDQTVQVEGQRFRVSIDGDVVPAEQTYKMRKFSEWQGMAIAPTTHLPFGWVTRRKARVYDAPRGKKIDELTHRTRVDIVGEETHGRRRWLKLDEGRFVRADDLNEVRSIARPEGTGDHAQWIDVDLGEQVLVAYRDAVPVYATLLSSGRPPHTTPRGNYPLWGKVSAITMQSQPYDDKPYYVHRVPWVLFFQAHNALHGAYWHDRFGFKKSHGCANLAPRDARYLFEWVEPKLPPGWTALRYTELSQAPVVHVRNTRYRHPFRQERPVGPPDPEAEAKRLEAAEARRARELEEQLEQQQAAFEQGYGFPPTIPQDTPSSASPPPFAPPMTPTTPQPGTESSPRQDSP